MASNVSHTNATHYFQPTNLDEQLPLKLGLILLASTIFFLFLTLVFLICRRLKRYAKLLNEDDDDEEKYDDEQEITQFDLEKLRLAKADEQNQNRLSKEPPVTQTLVNEEQAEPSAIDRAALSAFSLGDEDDDDIPITGSNGTAMNPSNCYAKPEPIHIITRAVAVQQPAITLETEAYVSKKQTVQSTESDAPVPPKDSGLSMDQVADQLEQPRAISVPKVALRRVSSTPNIQLERADDPGRTDDPNRSILSALDDANLFEDGATEDELDMVDADGTLVPGNEDEDSHPSNICGMTDSIGDIGSIRPLLPIQLPDWALQSGSAERGFLVFSMRINRKPGAGPNRFLVDVRVLEARCILSRNLEAKAGKFYVKARIQSAGMKQSQSILSLSQLNPRSGHSSLLSDRPNAFSFGRNNMLTSGRTPIRRAFRSPVFWHAITLETPANYDVPRNARSIPQFGTPLAYSVNKPTDDLLELRLDLKQRGALSSDALYGGTSNVLPLPQWKKSQVLGFVRITLTPRMWDFFLHDQPPEQQRQQQQQNRQQEDDSRIDSGPLRRSTLVPKPDGSVTSDSEEATLVERPLHEQKPPRTLRFVRRLEVPVDEMDCRGDLTIGMQYNPEAGRLTLNPLKCSGVTFPKGTKSIFLRAALVSNRKLIGSQQSNPSARLTLNAAEFLLGERLQFSIEEHLSQVCLILSVFARSGGKLQENNITLLGRCVTGPNGLAYGEGLAHWNAIIIRRRMVKRTHVLF